MSSAFGINFGYKSLGAKEKAIKAQENICPICGKSIDIKQKTTTEHIFPRAIAKWGLLSDEENSKCIALLNSKDNAILVHKRCNTSKGMRLPNLDELYLSEEHKEKLEKLEGELAPYIRKLRYNILQIAATHNQECAVCGKFVNIPDITLRRKDGNIARSLENSAIVHCWCNYKYGIERKTRDRGDKR